MVDFATKIAMVVWVFRLQLPPREPPQNIVTTKLVLPLIDLEPPHLLQPPEFQRWVTEL